MCFLLFVGLTSEDVTAVSHDTLVNSLGTEGHLELATGGN